MGWGQAKCSGLTCFTLQTPGTLLRNEATSGSQIPDHQLEEKRPEELLDMLDFE